VIPKGPEGGAEVTVSAQSQVESPGQAARPLPDSTGLDWLVAVLSCWFVGGVYLDGWAHGHIASLETFFTPWHAVLYSGYAVTAAALILAVGRRRRTAMSWREAAPPGYELSVLGVAIFAVGGLCDMIWHLIFGIEASVDALLSPTHLMLALGMTLLITGPFRAACRRTDTPGGQSSLPLPALISLTLTLSVFTFFTQYASPLGQPLAAQAYYLDAVGNPDLYLALGITSILLQSAIVMGLVLLALRRWRLPPGSLTLLIGVNGLLMVLESSATVGLQPSLILAAFASGVAADCLLLLLPPAGTVSPRFASLPSWSQPQPTLSTS
jgi:hypothetical protein